MKASVEVAAKAAPSSKAVNPPGSYYDNTSLTVEVPVALLTLLNETPPSLTVEVPIALWRLLNETPPLPQLNGQCSNKRFPLPPLPSQNETPFIFEEPKKSYFLLGHAERAQLLSLGPLAPRWLDHMERIHVIVQSPSQIQVMVARCLDLPHYQATMVHVQETIHPSIHFYQDEYAANDFIYVSCQHSKEVTSLLSTINFEEIGANLLLLKPADSVRQSFYQDLGICTSQCSSRKGEPLGISKPRDKLGSKEKALLVTCSKVLLQGPSGTWSSCV
jgi:hypothetical protein